MSNTTILVCAGSSYVDIDAYGCCVAYTELLKLMGYSAFAYTTATPNYSVPGKLINFGNKYFLDASEKLTENEKKFIIVDVSNPEFFEEIVTIQDVIEVIDHHTGFETFWKEKLGSNARIEFIGAACTIVYEIWEKSGFISRMSNDIAQLLIAGILDNTLNMKANITSQRDIFAYEVLCKIAGVSENWREYYFCECQRTITNHLTQSLNGDIKHVDYPSVLPPFIGQIAVWDASLLMENSDEMEQTMNVYSNCWLINLISINKGISFLFCKDTDYKVKLEKLLCVKFIGDIATADRMWLRKEIMKEAQSFAYGY